MLPTVLRVNSFRSRHSGWDLIHNALAALLFTPAFSLLQALPHVVVPLWFAPAGKSVYFWSLVSALGTFALGAGVTMRHSLVELMNPTLALEKV